MREEQIQVTSRRAPQLTMEAATCGNGAWPPAQPESSKGAASTWTQPQRQAPSGAHTHAADMQHLQPAHASRMVCLLACHAPRPASIMTASRTSIPVCRSVPAHWAPNTQSHCTPQASRTEAARVSAAQVAQGVLMMDQRGCGDDNQTAPHQPTCNWLPHTAARVAGPADRAAAKQRTQYERHAALWDHS